VLISLSRSSNNPIDWIIGLSCLFTSSWILLRENVWARPSLLWSSSMFSNSSCFKKSRRCCLNPLMSSLTMADVVVWICSASLIEPAILLSLTPSLTFDFFLRGKFSERKSTSCWGAFPAMVLLITSSATADD